jgi:tRNA-uridine 2-sulfurtransferase
MSNPNTKIIIGLSGGVDSSVAAYLLKQQGYLIEAVFMKNWESDDNDEYCTAETDAKDAKAVCEQLDIPLHIVSFAKEYWDHVFEYFLDE